MQKLTLKELENKIGEWKRAIIVFKQTNFFIKEFSEIERSYEISSDAKYGDCLDGKEHAIRLDCWLFDGAKIDY